MSDYENGGATGQSREDGTGSLLSGSQEQAGQQGTEGTQTGQQGTEGTQAATDGYQPFDIPEGMGSLNEETFQEVSALGAELGLNQQQLQKIVDLGVKKFGEDIGAVQLKLAQAEDELRKIREERDNWERTARGDPEITRNLHYARRFVDAFRTPELEELLSSGVGNNPALIRVFIAAGKKYMSEAPFATGGSPAGARPSTIQEMARAVYPNFS